ncbi:uncharacterized protein LOC114121906 isoform X2 [Aphis gossypii]|uniref:uncharacterized protein LOC114121906 isoform X2 n=1 Tax=Aphis gossypii TaxID=80765 RepID=UPI002159054D|nr:uncharacterized protein LOC114121906 isoform X2 [Aphis gossypii]
MSKYKYLIIILMIMKSLSYSKAADFSNIFILDESCEDFNKRMEEQGLPLIGQTFETYEESFKLNAEYQRKNIHQLNKEEYTVLMNSIPRINDTLEDVNKRNSYDVEQGTTRYNNKIQQEFEDSKGKGEYKLQQYSEIIFKQLKIRYPQIYETYYEYSRRLKENKLEPLGKEFVNWLKMLFPIFGETYDEYTKRMEEKLLIPMQRESFILYQIYYPIPWVEYKQFNKTMDFLGKSNIFPALGLEKFPQEIFDYLKSQFPEPFESQESFDKRIFVNKVYDRIFSKRIYPKMSETFLEYMERIENIFFPKQSEIKDYIYNEYKIKYYPEFNLDYSEIRRSTNNDNIIVTISLSTRMPIVFETFPHYKQRMFMLALNGLDEEEFNDLKRTYIEQCETYMNYVIRMQELEIKPMDFKYALQLKIIVPREDELDPTSNEDNFNDRYKTIKDEKDPIIMLEDSSFFIEHPETAELATDFYNREKVRGNYQEGFTGKRRVVKFHKINRQIFILIHPRPYENYTKYKDRIGKVRENYVFEDSLEIEPFGHEIFKTFIQPLTENEFKDLKSRFPKLSETMHSYTTRLEEYRLPIVINPNLFKTFKRSQIQPFDKFEIYQLRYQKLESNKKKLLAKMNISFCEEYKEYNSFPSFLKTLDPYDYKDMKDVCPKYYHTLTEYNTIMENLYLQQFEMDMFIMIKEGFPHLLDNDYGKYKSRVDNSSLSFLNEEEFIRLKSFIPKRFESLNAFEIRISINIYTADDIENFKSIYPKVCSTLDEFTITMKNMGIVSLIKETYEFYNNQFPERDETKYDDYHKRVTGKQYT